MAQRYIYLADELNARLKKEDNASALISTLLNKYYKIAEDIKVVLTKEEMQEELKNIQTKINAYRELGDLEGMAKYENEEKKFIQAIKKLEDEEIKEILQNKEWEEKKKLNAKKAELRKQYELENKDKNLNVCTFDEYLIEHGIINNEKGG